MPMPPRVRNIDFGKAFADASALWRAERELLVPIAGVFFFVPLLGMVMLLATSGIKASENDPQAMWAAMNTLARTALVPMLLFNIVTSFGSFAILNVLLQGGGRTLGEVLLFAVRRFLPFLGMDLVLGIAFNIGFFSLLFVPGLFLLCRTWLAAPAYSAAPERGLIAALQQGWWLSGRWNWLIVLLALAAVFLGTAAIATMTALLLSVLAVFGREAATVATIFVAVLLTTAAWLALTLLRVALYRASVPKEGM